MKKTFEKTDVDENGRYYFWFPGGCILVTNKTCLLLSFVNAIGAEQVDERISYFRRDLMELNHHTEIDNATWHNAEPIKEEDKQPLIDVEKELLTITYRWLTESQFGEHFRHTSKNLAKQIADGEYE